MEALALATMPGLQECQLLVRFDAFRDDAQLEVFPHSDHGGHDHTHGTNMPEDMTIIWMLNGPGIKKGHVVAAPITLLDTAPTIAHALGLHRPEKWDGQPVLEAFE